MSAFGDKVPVIGTFVRGYGDVGGGLLKATLALDQKLIAAEGGELIDGVHGSRKEMLDRLRALGIEGAHRVEGLRDVYVADGGKVLVWDQAARDWAVASDVEKGITPEELARRYRHYAGRGIKNPSVEQLLQGYSRTVVISLEASAGVVEPGQPVTLVPSARLVKDDRPVGGGLYVTVVEQSHTGFGSGSFSGPTKVMLGEKVTWTAPDNVGETYVLAADLSEESAKVARSTGPGTARVRTGAASSLTLQARPKSVAAGGEVELLAQAFDAEGAPLPAKASGTFAFSASPAGGSFGSYRSLDEGKGVTQSWRAPLKAGSYTVTATYSGAVKGSLLGSHQAGAQASVTVEVRPADFELSVDAQSKPASREAPAVFTVTLENRDAAPRRFALGGRVSPKEQAGRWRRSADFSGTVEVAAGQTRRFSFTFSPASDEATRLTARATAAPVGGGEGKSVEFSATAEEEAKTVALVVAAAGQNGKAQVAGSARHEAKVEAGAKISLSFQPWGPRREYCTKDVIEKNRNMKQVVLFGHGPKGCSFGTEDGRMHAEWKVTEEKISWSGPGVSAAAGSERAEFVVPAEPGSYTVTATGTVAWAYERNTPAGRTRQSETESSSATFTITVRKP